MKPSFLLLLTLLFIQSLTAQSTGEKLKEFMDAAYKAKLFNGTVLAARHDSILFAKGYGWRDYEHRVQHDTNSIFGIGSLTKEFTTVVILYLQEQNKLKVTDKVSKYFPEYKYGGKISIKNLLTHTSGIFDFTEGEKYQEILAFDPFSQQNFWNIIKDQSLDFEPDSQFYYSNSNYYLLGYIIEKVTGKPYEQNVREIIFNKAGMTHSGFDFARLQSPYKTVGYDELNDGVHIPARVADSGAAYASGGIYSTVGDLFRWHKALLSNKIISRQSLEEAFTPYKGPLGYSWYIRYDGKKRQVLDKGGGIPGFQALFIQLPEDSICYMALSNDFSTCCNPETELNFIDAAFLQIFANNPNYYIPRSAITPDAATLPEYTGSYKRDTSVSYIIDITLNDNHLQSVLNNGQANELFEEKKDFFFLKSFNCQIEFERGADGKIKDLIVYFNKQKARYRKIK